MLPAYCSQAQADQVIVQGVSHTEAKIVGLDQGRLQFRIADGRTLSAWVDEVGLMLVDRGGVFDDFNQAEQFLHGGDPLKAIARYERTLRLTQEFWPDLIACRLAAAHDLAGQIDRAAYYLVRMIQGEFAGVGLAARLYPRNIPEKRDARVARAVDILADESRKAGDDDRRSLMDILRYEILAKTDPTAAKPLARGVAEQIVPAPARTEHVYEVVLQAMKEINASSTGGLNLAVLDRAIRDCPENSMPEFLILKGQILQQGAQTREQKIHAAWAFMRVPIHWPDHELAPQALLDAGRTVYEFDKEKAKVLLAECSNHPKATPELRKQAEYQTDAVP